MVAAGVGIGAPGESPGTEEEALAAVKLLPRGRRWQRDRRGQERLHGAARRDPPRRPSIPILRLLVEKGARLDARNSKGWLPLFAAEGVVYASSGIRRYPEAAALLREAMVARGIAVDEAGRLLTARARLGGR